MSGCPTGRPRSRAPSLRLDLHPEADVTALHPIAQRLADSLDVEVEQVADAIADAYLQGVRWGVAEQAAQLIEAGVELTVHLER